MPYMYTHTSAKCQFEPSTIWNCLLSLGLTISKYFSLRFVKTRKGRTIKNADPFDYMVQVDTTNLVDGTTDIPKASIAFF